MTKNSISFIPMTEKNLPLLHEWFHKPHVKLWYARNEDYTIEMIYKKYISRLQQSAIIPNFIIYVDSHPIGYIQLYNVDSYLPDGISDYQHPLFSRFKSEEIAGVDMFIADTNYLGKGYGALALDQFIKSYVDRKFSALIVDPVKSNKNAIQFFVRNGFKKLEESRAEGGHELMIRIIE